MNYDKIKLRDPDENPTVEKIKDALQESFKAYEVFYSKLDGFELNQVWQYYPCGGTKAWLARGRYEWTTIRGAKKEKNIYWLSVWEGCFRVVVWFLSKNRLEILNSNINEETKSLIKNAKTLGKLNTFPVEFEVTSVEMLEDIYTLIKLKKKLEA